MKFPKFERTRKAFNFLTKNKNGEPRRGAKTIVGIMSASTCMVIALIVIIMSD